MFNLKAELHRKKLECEKQEETQTGQKSTAKSRAAALKKVLPWNKKNKGIEERSATDVKNMTTDEIDKHEKSRAILEEKAKLYEKMSSGEMLLDDESSEMFLVDFEQKSVDAWRDKRDKGLTTTAPKMNVKLKDVMKEKEKQDEWVEYVDVLGRTRQCRRDELHLLHKIDDKLQNNTASTKEQEKQPNVKQRTLMSDDMRREEQREKWEEEIQKEIEEGKEDYHYEDIRSGEIRELGVGYYAFSRSKEEREAEMEHLMKMRQETEKNKQLNKEKKMKEKTALEIRLEKVRQRRIKKLQKQGKKIPASLLEPVQLKNDEDVEKKVEKEEDAGKVEVIVEKMLPTTSSDVREWDKDKEPVWKPAEPKPMPRSWKDPHDDDNRNYNFAPPPSYFQQNQPSETTLTGGRRKRPSYQPTLAGASEKEEDGVEPKKVATATEQSNQPISNQEVCQQPIINEERSQPISNEERMRRLLNSLKPTTAAANPL